MQIVKQSMNWLPRASAWQEAESARLKRKAANAEFMSTSSTNNATLISTNTSSSDSVNLTMQMAMTRLRSGKVPKV